MLIDINNLNPLELARLIADEINQRYNPISAFANGVNIYGNIQVGFMDRIIPIRISVPKLIFTIDKTVVKCQRPKKIDLHNPASIDTIIKSFCHCMENRGCSFWNNNCPIL